MVTKKGLSNRKKKQLIVEDKLLKESVRKNEDKQLAWIVAIIFVVLVFILGIYYWTGAVKSFEFGGVEWIYEENVDYYHGRFANLLGDNFIYNIYLKNDPRKNGVQTEGIFNEFRYGVVISMSPDFDLCKGDASRVMRDLGAFMREGFGIGPLEVGSTNEEIANSSERKFATCDNINDRTVIIIERGDNFVVQDDENPYCYVISVGDCNDASAVEKFMLKVINDFGGA